MLVVMLHLDVHVIITNNTRVCSILHTTGMYPRKHVVHEMLRVLTLQADITTIVCKTIL